MSRVAFTCRSIRGPVGGAAGDGCKLDMSRVNVPWPEGPSYAMVVASVSEACQLTPGGQRRLALSSFAQLFQATGLENM